MKHAVTLGIIPARGGSKGVPNKNIRVVGGKPLIAYTIEAALAAKALDSVLVSTDSNAIAEVAAQFGLPAAELRPAELATDTTPTIDVIRYEIERFEERTGAMVDVVVVLQPTTPLRTSADIDSALELLSSHAEADSVITGYDATGVHPRVMHRRSESTNYVESYLSDQKSSGRRQDFEQLYVRNGAVYAARRELVMQGNRLYSDNPLFLEMPRLRSVNIDDETDLRIAEAILRALDPLSA